MIVSSYDTLVSAATANWMCQRIPSRFGTSFMADDPASPFSRWLGHPDFEAFVRAAAVAPHDRAWLLVLSDWLQDQGDDVAAELARGPNFREAIAVARFRQATGARGGHVIPAMAESFCGIGESVGREHGPGLEMLCRIRAAMTQTDHTTGSQGAGTQS
jgi:uncharacterized protein (TIGR02996 family)